MHFLTFSGAGMGATEKTVFLVSLGCARNQVDSELMLGSLGAAGWEVIADPEDATAIVINTCSFIESAADESIEAILEMAAYKTPGRCRKLVVTGCLPERYREQISTELPEVDAFLGTGAYAEILQVIEEPVARGTCLLPDPDLIQPQGANAPRQLHDKAAVAYLKIAEGCSRHCTYCIIPKLRGKQKSRRPEDIIAEAEGLAARGVKEIVLVAQDTTYYGQDTGSAGLAGLLDGLADALPGLWIRFLYGHPESIQPDVWAVVSRHTNICSYFDIPIQHASNGILHRMGRHYSADDLLTLFDRIRRAVPGVALRTTVITGFPGETQEDFAALTRFVSRVRFDHLGVFTYSDSDDLPSHQLPHHVPVQTAQDRHDSLMALQLEISKANNSRWLDTEVDVLVEEHPEPGVYIGRTMLQAPEVDGLTILHADHIERGTIVRVRITDTLEYDLIGKVL